MASKPDTDYERDPMLSFRAPEAVIVSASTAAAREGVSKSELVRRALAVYLEENHNEKGGRLDLSVA